MLAEFIDFVESVLPSVDAEAKDKAKKAIEQFNKKEQDVEYLLPKLLPCLSQGDIISEIPFTIFDKDGEQYIYKAKGMVISTSCNIDQKQLLNIVPVLPLSDFDGNKTELKKNKIYSYMYFSENCLKDYFIDFSKVNTYNKELISKGIDEGRIKRVASLNQMGFYLFIIKLTVFLMRKEDDETMEQRA